MADYENEYENEEGGEDHVPKKKSNTAQWILIGIIVLLLAVNGIQLYLHTKNKEKIEKQTTTIQKQDKNISAKKDSLNAIKQKLEQRIKRIEALGDTAKELRTKVSELEDIKKGLTRKYKAWRNKYYSYKNDIEGLLKKKDNKINKLKAIRDSLHNQNKSLKDTISENKNQISALEKTKKELSKKVTTAEALQAANADIYAIKKLGSGKYDKEELRGWRVDKMVFEFDILKNKLAPVGKRTFYLRIVDPEGAAMYNLDKGSGTFKFEDREIYYTKKKTAVYEKKKLPIKFEYVKDKWKKEGKYDVEVYCGGRKIGEGHFKIK